MTLVSHERYVIVIIFVSEAHKTYIGFIYLEYIQNHSVMNAFVLLLEQSLRKTEPLTEDVLPSVPTSEAINLKNELVLLDLFSHFMYQIIIGLMFLFVDIR